MTETVMDVAPSTSPGAITKEPDMIAFNVTAAVLGTFIAARLSTWTHRRRVIRGGSMN